MRRLYLIPILLLLTVMMAAQSTIITGTVADPAGNVYPNSPVTVDFFNPDTKIANWNSFPLQATTWSTNADSFGAFSIQVPDLNFIAPAVGTFYKIKACANTVASMGGGGGYGGGGAGTSGSSLPSPSGQPTNPCGLLTTPACPTSGCITGSTISVTTALQAIMPPNPIVSQPASLGGNNIFTGSNTFNGAANLNGGGAFVGTFTGNHTESGNGTFSGSNTFSGANTLSGANIITAATLNGSQIFADQKAGADNSTKIQAGITACIGPTCLIDGSALPSEVAGGSTVIDPGASKIVTILLPAGTTYINQILLRSSLHIYGMGSGGGAQQSILQSCSTCTTIDMFAIGGTAPVSGIDLGGFRIYGANGSAGAANQSAFGILAGAAGGFWYSEVHDITILGMSGAGGTHGVIRLDASAGIGGINQFDQWRRVYVYRTTGGGPAIEVNGFTGQQNFLDGQYDSQPSDLTGTNVLIKSVSSSLFPFNILFEDATIQGGNVAVNVDGGNNITFHQSHHEKSNGGYLIGATNSGVNGIHILDSQFNANVGINGGAGYLVNFAPAATSGSVEFRGNNFGSTPDHIVLGNIAAVTQMNNTGGVQVGGTIWNTASGFPYLTVNTGIVPDSSGFKHKRFAGNLGGSCPTAAAIGAVCTSAALSWTTPFADANYTVNCTLSGAMTGQPHIVSHGAPLAGSITLTIAADTAAATNVAPTGFADCVAVHD